MHLANDGTGIIIAGTYWAMWIKEKQIPKKALASIIELTGILPEAGEAFRATKDGNQMEMDHARPAMYEVAENAATATRELQDTKLVLETANYLLRLLQAEGTNEIYAIKDWIHQTVDDSAVEKGEGYPTDPALGKYNGIYWLNDTMAFMVLPTENESPLIGHLERVNIEQYQKHGADVPETPTKEETENSQGEHPAE